MKRIADYVSSSASINEIKQEVLSHPNVIKMLKDNNLDHSKVDHNLTDLFRYINAYGKCRNCSGLKHCQLTTTGYYPVLVIDNNELAVAYVPCEFQKEINAKNKKKSKLRSMYMPDKDYDDFEHTEERMAVMDYLSDFIQQDTYMRGMFLYGKPGVGKTRILTVTAKKLSQTLEVLYVNYPDFVREIKGSISEGTLERKVSLLKNVKILVLDDFGDEGAQSAWFRDEVLMPILQARMAEKKPVFFGSNYSLEALRDAFTTKVKDAVKVERLMERVRTLSKPFELKGRNYRE
jgi:primosomal protein DnaI